ncbi:sensor histidine kinase [Massilia sp. CCM 8733]|uniref:Sensor histidine kinase n=1 Tax=Massilia mucilaginosa TaxID=2609282 RepID=A0ABX0NLI6_9BURK|nr:histidine kinase [Massilia mucilaginosa]NHZ87670.1 sensor histidine kinase [Massilia mucilaginosa]
MQGPFSTRRGAGLYLLAWLLLAIVFAGLIVAASGAAWTDGLLFTVPVTLLYACAAGFSSYYLCRAYRLGERSAVSVLAVFAVAAVVASLAWTALCIGWNHACAAIAMTAPLQAAIFGLGVILYALCAVAHYLALELERARAAERRELEAALMAQDTELRMLRTQIDPHFLFNSLNSISALTSIDPARARDMTLRLADFFRHSLGLAAGRKVTLEAEATLAMHFIAIEKVRFGARLNIEQAIDAGALDCLLPPMILQPLVENAVKHGIAHLTGGGTIRIAAQRAGSVLKIVVENDIDDDAPAVGGHGIGLANVRQRLTATYGHEAGIHWTREAHQFRVALSLPFHTTESPACAS